MLVIFLAAMGFRKFSQKFPPIIVAMVVGAVLLYFFGLITPVTMSWQFAQPRLALPSFSWSAILNISVPLFFLVIGVQNIQAVGVLLAEGYTPPINAMYLIPSIGAFIQRFYRRPSGGYRWSQHGYFRQFGVGRTQGAALYFRLF